MIIDTHCHVIDLEYDNIDEIINRFKDNIMIISGYDSISNRNVVDIVKKYKNVYGTLGFHPSEVDKFSEEEFNYIKNNINNSKIVGIGELGLDYHYSSENKEKHQQLFEYQLSLAEKYSLPVVIHTRDATNDTINILKKHNVKGIIHCFSGSYETACQYINMGFLLGIGGVITFKNCHLKETVKKLSLKNIVLETDSPYLAPVPYRGKINSPKNIPVIAEFLAKELEQNVNSIEKITTENTKSLFTRLK